MPVPPGWPVSPVRSEPQVLPELPALVTGQAQDWAQEPGSVLLQPLAQALAMVWALWPVRVLPAALVAEQARWVPVLACSG